MPSLSRSRSLWGWALACLIPALLPLSGCTGRPENSPVIRKKFQEMAELQTQVGDMAIQVKQISADQAAIRTDIAAVRSLGGNGDAVAQIEEIDTRMGALEQEISKLREALTADSKSRQVASAAAGAEEESAPAPKASVEKSEKSSSGEKHVASASTSSSRKAEARSSTRSSAPARQAANTAKPKPRGAYYTIQSGDTPREIAQKHNVSLDSLLQANRLPKDATVFPGQKLYVPGHE